ncbi:zinc finger protein 271-like [Parambassis ranga]|uniref:Zinc finger protein 271-like n=1 Tax=Parambassis ranga TaxID=210632 RepID=A0A6P7I1P0_9TELE|nr:zinc finger protein 271-like [Parambassis ranga]
MDEKTVKVEEELIKQELSLEPLPEPLLIILSPPPSFLPVHGKPSILWPKWLKSFEHYIKALGEKELIDYTKCLLLKNCLGPEGENILTTLIPNESTYSAAISALTAYFSCDQTTQMHRLKFHQRAQMPGETLHQFVLALEELLSPCNYGHLHDKLILEQLIEKTNYPQLRERLLLVRDTLTLETALVIGNEVESVLNEPHLFKIHEVCVDIGDDLDPPVQKKAKRGRPRRGEERKETKPLKVKTSTTRKGRPHKNSKQQHKKNVQDKQSYHVTQDLKNQHSTSQHVCTTCGKTLGSSEGLENQKRTHKSHVLTCAECAEKSTKVVKKRGRPRRGEERAKVKPCFKKTPQRHKDNYYYSNDKQYYSDGESKSASQVNRADNITCDDEEASSSSRGWEDGASNGVSDDTEASSSKTSDDNDEEFVPASINLKGPCCPLCDNRRFRDASKLARHMRTHTKEKPFTCSLCDTTFSQSYHMTRHMKNQHGVGQHICRTCGKGLGSSEELEKHKKTHMTEVEEFTDVGTLSHHTLSHVKHQSDKKVQRSQPNDGLEVKTEEMSSGNISSNNGDSQDKECDANVSSSEATSQDGGRKKEVDPASNTNGHFCPVCVGRRFRGANKLARHMRTHTKEKPFSCRVCAKTFSQSYHMTRHVRNQHGLSNHICSKCGTTFSTWLELKAHRKTHAEDLTCLVCDEQFMEKSAFASHLKTHKRVRSSPRSLTCSYCGKVFGRMYHLKRHIVTHRKTANAECYTCPDCQKDFAFPEDLNKHLEIHEKENNGTCPKCDETFGSPEELEKHMEAHRKSYSCSICGKKFKVEYALKKHVHSHQNGHYYCSLCSKHILKLSHYKRHMMVHRRRESRCPHCDTVFLQLTALKYHLRTHIEERPYQCTICIETFVEKEDLEQHCLKHRKLRKERPYSCTRCDYAFCTLMELTEHMSSHEGEQPLVCSDCGKTFLNKNKLEKHLSIHTGERPHLCSICGNGFPSSASLRLHSQIHTGEKPFKCSQCTKTFSSSSGLRLHSRQHMEVRPSYKCPECGRTYGRMTELKMHQRYHTGDKPYACTCCSKRFISKDKLNVHMRIHTGERPYSCPHCGQTFTQTGDRNRHISKYH